jgi:hypothetical protein
MTVRCNWSQALNKRARVLLAGAAIWMGSATAAPTQWVSAHQGSGDFVLADGRRTPVIVYAAKDAKVVELAARDLAADIARVVSSGPRATPVVRSLVNGKLTAAGSAVLIGTLGRSPLIDNLVNSGKLDASHLRGAWESFVVTIVERPAPGVPRALVIAGSDPRGTAFGVYELSQAIGVSPWYWWADVTPDRKSGLYIAAGTHRFGPPSVKYRGIFLNDEDWGLQPWAATTMEPENGGIGPKTYGRVFELLLRLKANTLWPAMHPSTRPFNADPRNAALASDYSIVMGSSHAEPMLRNNVGEWKAPAVEYNYATNSAGVQRYWEERVAANGKYENLYTLGMRGIHDSGMQGPKTDAERIKLLQKIFTDQRDMLARHVGQAPQLFCAYKEVLPLYRQGLQVPDDVTIIWPDDNFGYIRNYANAEEQKRSGGFGVYYHLSYLGAPLSYLWLYTTPPALVWEEMSKAYETGAREVWIANVGDLKPAEIGTEFFLQMAWEVKRWQRAQLPDFLPQWAAREFGLEHAAEIGAIMERYFRLNYQRKPEHLQWWLPKESPRASTLSPAESAERLQEFRSLRKRVERLQALLPAEKQDAFFELVRYPVTGAALANVRYFEGEQGKLGAAQAANDQLAALTAQWDGPLADGKWRHIMSMEPADAQWHSMRLSAWTPELAESIAAAPKAVRPPAGVEWSFSVEAEAYNVMRPSAGAAWELIPGLGRSGKGAVAIFPVSTPSLAESSLATEAPRMDYDLDLPAAGSYTLQTHLIPTHPLSGGALRFAVSIDEGRPQLVEMDVRDGGPEWAHGVLDSVRVATAALSVDTPGKHTLHIYGVDPGVVLDKLVIAR